jgi:flagellar basal-body rod protein FlgC
MKARIMAIVFGIMLCVPGVVAHAEDLSQAMNISASGMRVQSDRLRIISQNIANADSTGLTPGADPYRRKTIFFESKRDPKTGAELVRVKKYDVDRAPFELQYEPTHPAANQAGYVKLPNVNTMIEAQDAKEAQRSYEANLNMIDVSRNMMSRTIDILR